MSESVATRGPKAFSLPQNFAWTFVGNGVHSASRWLVFSALAKASAPEQVGIYAFSLAVVTPIFAFTNMNLRALQATDASSEYASHDYIGLRLITSLVGLVVCLVAASMQSAQTTGLVLILLGLAQVSESLSDVLFGLFQRVERMDQIATSMMLRGPLRLILLAVLLLATHNLVLAVLGDILGSVLVLVLYDVPRCASMLGHGRSMVARGMRLLRPRWHWRTLTRLLGISTPMALLMSVAAVQAQMPRYVLEHYRGNRDVGLFSALSALAGIGAPVSMALGQAASPRIARHLFERNVAAFWRLMLRLQGIAAVMGIGSVLLAVVFGPVGLALLYTNAYAAYNGVLVWLAIASAIGYVTGYLGAAITALRTLYRCLFVTAAALLVSIPAYMELTRGWGMVGAAWALCIQNGLLLVGMAILLHRSIHERF